ncbi:hypothetical protein GTZ97_12340 [Aquabacterium fontiphilum]|uniref:hypothetical protein n=1 Tax=Aquabacterium fontiphilum TaxID=450365 RepID=UPI0013790921|nr:hypothetical protein [Aquabacterium fontiphilum]NBD21453.1 hypothetical protein [Aquabacterium fontiphilum]
MGYSIAWIATRGIPLDQALIAAGLSSTSTLAEFASKPFTGQAMRHGWYLLVAKGCDSPLIASKVLAELSTSGEVIACAIEEHVMFSSAEFWQGGHRIWKVAHSSDKGIRHLSSSGAPPASFQDIVAEANRLQEQDSEVDYFFDVPLTLASKLCGFKHDEARDGLNPEQFLVYTKGQGHKKWWQFW